MLVYIFVSLTIAYIILRMHIFVGTTFCRQIQREVGPIGADFCEFECIPLFSTLPPYLQQCISEPAPPRKPNGAIERKVSSPRKTPTRHAQSVRFCFFNNFGVISDCYREHVQYVYNPYCAGRRGVCDRLGFAKQKLYNPRVRVESLLVTAISYLLAKISHRAEATWTGNWEL